jgi:hypothetical protein
MVTGEGEAADTGDGASDDSVVSEGGRGTGIGILRPAGAEGEGIAAPAGGAPIQGLAGVWAHAGTATDAMASQAVAPIHRSELVAIVIMPVG